jgi:hypothetical protein
MNIHEKMKQVLLSLAGSGVTHLMFDTRVAQVGQAHIILLSREAFASPEVQEALASAFESQPKVTWIPEEDADSSEKTKALSRFREALLKVNPSIVPKVVKEVLDAGTLLLFPDTPMIRATVKTAMNAYKVDKGVTSLIILFGEDADSVQVISHTSSAKAPEAKPKQQGTTLDELQDPARNRERGITPSDIQDISILVNTASTLEELLQGMETIGATDGY